jgi:hypothetical protein
MKNAIRSVLSVFAGIFTYLVSTLASTYIVGRIAPSYTTNVSFLMLTIVCSVIFAAVSGYVTASLAPTAPMKHAIVLTILVLIREGVASAYLLEGIVPRWFQIALVALPVPMILFGGSLKKPSQSPA